MPAAPPPYRAAPPAVPEAPFAQARELMQHEAYVREREQVERQRHVRALLVLALVVIALGVARAGVDRVFSPHWWKPW